MPQRSELLKVILQTVAVTLLLVILLFGATAGVLGFYAYRQAKLFSDSAGVSIPELIEVARAGWRVQPRQNNQRVNFLILGTDELASRGTVPVLTDTMMVASLNLNNGQLNMLSVPRDLWSAEYQTRINALYTYGKDRYPDEPARFPREVIEELFELQTNYTVILKLETVGELIDAIGGVEVEVQETFVDPLFPRPDVDVTVERDPQKLYQTVIFTEGTEKMTGERALQYIRSRHSTGNQGDDVARSVRQQAVITSLIATLRQPSFYKDFSRAGKLYSFYQKEFAQFIPITEVIGMVKQLYPVKNQVSLQSHSLSIFPDEPTGSITHPPVNRYQGQWVYEVRDKAALEQEVHQKLQL